METVDLRELEFDPDARVLDVGCGDGRHIRGVLNRSEDIFGVGLDLSLERLRDAFKKFWEFPLKGTGSLVMSNLHRLPFDTGSFQAVICSEVLEHIHEPGRAVVELNRVLEPGGTIGVSVPMWLAEKGCWKLSEAYPEKAGHLQIFRANDLIRTFEENGFRLLKSHGSHAFHTPFWWLMCLTGDLLPLYQNPDPFEHDPPTPEWWWEWYEGRQHHPSRLVSAYYGFLVWYERGSHPVLERLERLLNPVLGRSRVAYFRKVARGGNA